jgi:hypothetical protein
MEEENDNLQPATPEPEAAKVPRAERRERAACDALRALLRDYYFQRFGAQAPDGKSLPVSLALRVRPDEAWATDFDPPFAEQIQGQLEDAQAGRGAYERGRVFCFRCQSSACGHAAPPGPLEVFRGYSSTGVPEWCEAVQAFVEVRDERVDQLYADPPAVLARMQYGHDLKYQQLSSFGRASKTYSLLGQVVAGYFLLPRRGRADRAAGRFAVTFQAVETRGAEGETLVKLNPVVGGMTPVEWDEMVVSEWRPAVSRALETAARAVEDVERRVRAARDSAEPGGVKQALKKIPQLLSRLARDLEQGDRQGARRTRHAESHPRQERPVHKALEDAREADEGKLFYDEKRGTWIACGRQGRTHAFSESGKHVTSFVLPAGGADFRVRTQRWRALRKEEIAEFHALIAQAAAGQTPAVAAPEPP